MVYLKTLLASVLSLILLFIIAKILGNKQISQLNMFDYINGITIGSIAAEMATNTDFTEVATTALAILVYGLAGIGISVVTLKSIRCRHLLSGREIILIGNGKIYPDSIKRARLDVNDLLTEARICGYYDISDIEWAILENNGKISFLPKAQATPTVRSDILPMTTDSAQPRPPVYVIIDGKVLSKNLTASGRDDVWLSRQLKAQHFSSASDVFLGYIDAVGQLVAYKQAKGEAQQDIFS